MRPRQIEMEIKNRVAELKEEMKKQSKLKRSAYIKNYKKKNINRKFIMFLLIVMTRTDLCLRSLKRSFNLHNIVFLL